METNKNTFIIEITNKNFGLINRQKNEWLSTNYKLDSNGNLLIAKQYNLSGIITKNFKINNEKLTTIYDVINEITSSKGPRCCDGDIWEFKINDENKFKGYVSDKNLEKVTKILNNYSAKM